MSRRAGSLLASDPNETCLDEVASLVDPLTGKYRFPDDAYRMLDSAGFPAETEALHRDGYYGDGIRIAVIDSGIDTAHAVLKDAVSESRDFSGSGNTLDRVGHGTLVALLLHYVAPKAQLINAKVMASDGTITERAITSAIRWVSSLTPACINLSVGLEEDDPLESKWLRPFRRLFQKRKRDDPLLIRLRGHWLQRCMLCDAVDHLQQVSPQTRVFVAVGNRRGKIVCPGRGSSRVIVVGTFLPGDSPTVAQYQAYWPDILAPEFHLKKGTSFSVPWLCALEGLRIEAHGRSHVAALSIEEARSDYESIIARWRTIEQPEVLAKSITAELRANNIPPSVFMKVLDSVKYRWPPNRCLVLLDLIMKDSAKMPAAVAEASAQWRSHLLCETGRYGEAIECARAGLALCPANSRFRSALYNVLGRAHFHRHEIDQSILALQQAISFASDDAESAADFYINLAGAFHGVQNYVDAEKTLMKAMHLAKSPQQASDARNQLATVLMGAGEKDWDKIRRLLNEVLRFTDSDDAPLRKARLYAYRNLGVVELAVGNLQAAAESYDKALQMAVDLWGPCHSETTGLYNFVFPQLVLIGRNIVALVERALRTLASAASTCPGDAEKYMVYEALLEKVLSAAFEKSGRPNGTRDVIARLRQRRDEGHTIDEPTISDILALFSWRAPAGNNEVNRKVK